jgi:hypothetical protein
MKIDLTIAADTRRAEIDLVFVHGGIGAANLIDQRQQWTSNGTSSRSICRCR